MPRFDAFSGPFNTTFSPNVQSEYTMNWLPEPNAVSVEGQGSELHDKNVRCALIRLPGLKTFVTLPNAPCRGVFPGEFRLFAVGGDHYYEIQAGGTVIDRSVPGFSGSSGIGTAGGTIGNDGRPVLWFQNGKQVLLISAGQAYCDSGNGPVPCEYSTPLTDLVIDSADSTGKTLTTATGNFFDSTDVGLQIQLTGGSGFNLFTRITIASVNSDGEAIGASSWGTPGSTLGTGVEWTGNPVTASYGGFLDGYGYIVPSPRTKDVFFSQAPDGTDDFTMWDPLNFFVKAAYPDNVMAMYADHEELYVMGDLECTEVFRNVGDANNPFMPDPGANMHVGVQAPFSVWRLGNGVAWIGQDTRRGTRRAIHAVGYQPQAVSTPAVQAAWAKYAEIDDAVSYTMTMGGHELWVISFPSANATWYYDATTNFWGQWGFWNGSGWDRHKVMYHCVVALDGHTDVHYGGDWNTGQIYTMSMNYKTDDGAPIARRRRAPHNTNENQRRFYARFEIDCDVLGLQRVFWNRLGNGRDRIWQMDSIQTSETAGVILKLMFSDDRTQTWQNMFTQTLDPSVDVQLANAYLKWVDATWN